MKRRSFLSFFVVLPMLTNAQTALEDVASELIKPNFRVDNRFQLFI